MKRNVKYKVLIAALFLVILAALIAGFFLSRNGDGSIHSAYDYGKQTTVTATKKSSDKTKTSSDKTSSTGKKKIVIPGQYVGILNKYQDALTAKSNVQALLRAGISPLLAEMYEGDPQKNVGFYVDDFNSDGTVDLLIGVVDGYKHFPYAILDYYTLDNNGEAMNVFQSKQRDYFTACTNARVLEKMTDAGKDYTAWYLYGLNSNGMQLLFREGLVRDYQKNKDKPWYRVADLDADDTDDKHLKNDAGETRQKQLDNARVQLDFTNFSKYNRANKAK